MTPKILVTGASGFIGSEVLREFSSRYTTYGLFRSANTLFVCDSNGTKLLHIDDHEHVKRLGITHIIHCAGIAHKRLAPGTYNLRELEKINVLLVDRLAQLAKQAGVTRFVFISSIGVSGDFSSRGEKIDDEAPIRPTNPYSRSKYKAESAIRNRLLSSSCQFTILRPPLVYGEGMKGNLVLLASMISRGVPIPLSNIPNRRSLISISNLVSAIEYAAFSKKAANRVYTVADAECISFEQLTGTISLSLNRPIRTFRISHRVLRFLASAFPFLRKRIGQICDDLIVSSKAFTSDTGWLPTERQENALLKSFSRENHGQQIL